LGVGFKRKEKKRNEEREKNVAKSKELKTG
jgi:hypothetical protein